MLLHPRPLPPAPTHPPPNTTLLPFLRTVYKPNGAKGLYVSSHGSNPVSLQKQTSIGIREWSVDIPSNPDLERFLWIYCPEHAGVKGYDLVGKATTTSDGFASR